MSMNLKQIMRRVTKDRIDNAQFVKLVKMKAGYGKKDGKAFVACQSYSTHHFDQDGKKVANHERRHYVTVIKFLDDKLNVNVSCSCDDFLYRWEWALANRGASDIFYSNGQHPDVTNPGMIPAQCKHLVKLVETIKHKIPGM
ncbi:hypothetical protein [Burkholderia phage BCSR5]|nr:hypothetical protein [Burkholderia phage BCSR5]